MPPFAPAPTGSGSPVVDIDALSTLLTQRVELPSWAFRGADPRFSSFVAPGAPRTSEHLREAVWIATEVGVRRLVLRAMTLDLGAWRAAEEAGDPHAANEVLLAANHADVTPLLQTARVAMKVPVDPVEAYHEACWVEHRDAERRAAVQRLVARRVAVLLGPHETGRASWPS